MGMFDSLYDDAGTEWQTKAFACLLDTYRVGDAIPCPDDAPSLDTFQVQVLGGGRGAFIDSFATVRDGILAAVPDDRDVTLPLIDYAGGLREHAEVTR